MIGFGCRVVLRRPSYIHRDSQRHSTLRNRNLYARLRHVVTSSIHGLFVHHVTCAADLTSDAEQLKRCPLPPAITPSDMRLVRASVVVNAAGMVPASNIDGGILLATIRVRIRKSLWSNCLLLIFSEKTLRSSFQN